MHSNKKGQVIIEWVLLVAVTFLIFGSIFTIVRANLFSVWVCEYWPRIASPRECTTTDECWDALEQGATPEEAQSAREVRDRYCD